jgi:biopolymer transport protein ExbD
MYSDDFNSSHKPLTEINIIPLVDVILVLLILFIITAPFLTPYITQINIPQMTISATLTDATIVSLGIETNGQLLWNKEPIDSQQLESRLHSFRYQKNLTDIQIYADKNTSYQKLIDVIAIVQKAGLSRISLVTTTSH